MEKNSRFVQLNKNGIVIDHFYQGKIGFWPYQHYLIGEEYQTLQIDDEHWFTGTTTIKRVG